MALKKLCLNMIVKNEMANLERCLASVAPYISAWIIGDTGSTDGTQDFIKSFFAKRGIPGELHSFPFHNFEQARNAALDCAAGSAIEYDYLLFTDADMELVVEDANFASNLDAAGYRLLQRSIGGLAYWNTRMVARRSGARYHGVTHEYIDVPGGVQQLTSVWYKDYASGSNRVEKFERDIRLLTDALSREPENTRYWFYLAQSYRDAGQNEKAVEAYAKRANMGGWDEEAWCARLQEARCRLRLGDEGGFLKQALTAFNMRPSRAEPLFDLARFHRDRGLNDVSVIFSEAGFKVPRPSTDILFIEDFVYSVGLEEEYSIAANYSRDPLRKRRGFAACNWLALNRTAPEHSRAQAWRNLYHYLPAANVIMPSFQARKIEFQAPKNYRLSSPSLACNGREIFVLQPVSSTDAENGEAGTRNFLLRLSDEPGTASTREILSTTSRDQLDGMRLIAKAQELYGTAFIRKDDLSGSMDQFVTVKIESATNKIQLSNYRAFLPEAKAVRARECVPLLAQDELRFISLRDPIKVTDETGRVIAERKLPIAVNEFRAGSQVISFDGGWLSLVQEMQKDAGPCYHRFIWLDADYSLKGVSLPFFLNSKGPELCAGLSWGPNSTALLISYSVGDDTAWIAAINPDDVRRILEPAESLQSGANFTVAQTAAEVVNQPGSTHTASETLAETPAAETVERITINNMRPGSIVPSAEMNMAKSEASVDDQGLRKNVDFFLGFAPFLREHDAPSRRREMSREFDCKIGDFLTPANTASLPQINCFYEALSDNQQHHQSLIASTTSMKAAGHRVKVWTYSPERLSFLRPYGVELAPAEEVISKGLYSEILARAEIRYFSDIFRYAVLYEHGGLWMDTDVILLRSFPFTGDYFFNLQWRTDAQRDHFICGNVMYAKPYSFHMRMLYERAIARCFSSDARAFGDVGPKLLSDYMISPEGASLRNWVFSPMFFNSIDWMEVDKFEQPISSLGEYLNDERVFGIHLWNAKTWGFAREGDCLISVLSNPSTGLPRFTEIADRFNTDKNRYVGNHHFYARNYDGLLASRRFALRSLMEIGLCRGLAEKNQTETPSVGLWLSYFPFCKVVGVDLTDFSAFNNDRFLSFVCDQSKEEHLSAVVAAVGDGKLDVIIDDGSHASFDQQLTLRKFFPLVADGGWFFIEDLDWQPPGEDPQKIMLTKDLLREIQLYGHAKSVDPFQISAMAHEFEEILFFDSQYELQRAKLLGGLVAIKKRGGSKLVN